MILKLNDGPTSVFIPQCNNYNFFLKINQIFTMQENWKEKASENDFTPAFWTETYSA